MKALCPPSKGQARCFFGYLLLSNGGINKHYRDKNVVWFSCSHLNTNNYIYCMLLILLSITYCIYYWLCDILGTSPIYIHKRGKHTLSSSTILVPPYSGSKTFSPTFTLTGWISPSWKKEKKILHFTQVKWKGNVRIAPCCNDTSTKLIQDVTVTLHFSCTVKLEYSGLLGGKAYSSIFKHYSPATAKQWFSEGEALPFSSSINATEKPSQKNHNN